MKTSVYSVNSQSVVQFSKPNDGFPVFISVIGKENIRFLDSVNACIVDSKFL